MRKTLLLTSALVLGSVPMAHAGGMPETVMSPDQIQENMLPSSGGLNVPLLLLVILAATLPSNGGSGGGLPSDIRLKEDITWVGTTHRGLPLYHYRYKGMPEVWEGVMAQDVEILHPKAISSLPFGYKAVDYASLGLMMRRVH